MARRHWLALAVMISSIGGLCQAATAQDLVAPDRIGRKDAPKSFTFRVLAGQSNNNPQPEFGQPMTALYERYARNHPDWRVDIELMSLQIPQEHARLIEQARGGRAPDCSEVDSFQVPLFIKQGVLKPISRYFSKEETADLFPFVLPIVTGPDGEIRAWWWTTDLRVIFRNTDLVPQAPETWVQLQEAALAGAAKAGKGVDGYLFNGGRNEVTTIDFLPYFWSQGGKLVDEAGKPVFGQEPNRTYLLKALAFYQGLVMSGAAPKRVASMSNYDDLVAASASGSTAMFEGGNWLAPQMRAAMKPAEFAKWQVSRLPGLTADHRSTATGGWTFAAFSPDPDKIKACVDLIREVYMGPANAALERIPTSRRLFDTLSVFQTPFYSQIKVFLNDGQARPGVPIYTEISNQLQIVISEVLAGTRTADTAVDEAIARVNRAADRP